MALNIKKSIILNTDEIASKKPFEVLLNNINNSWVDKNKSIQEGEELLKQISISESINFVPDSLKNKSLITYIDAPWGSGKTYFIESFLKYLNESNLKVNYSNEDLKDVEIDINIIDAWEIYNGSSINAVLGNIYCQAINEKDYLKSYKKINSNWDGNELRSKKINFLRTFEATTEIVKYAFPIISKSAKIISKVSSKNIENNVNIVQDMMSNIGQDEMKKISLAIIDIIENKFKNKNKMVVIDNIERLSSENRLDVVNKILNWANIDGTTFIFLTNFDKIKITKEFEEDFWNKISLHETFKLENSWSQYIEDYKYNQFVMSDHKELSKFILEIIPLFFSSNSDNMDIREIKKLLDNWLVNDENNLTTIEYIKQFLRLAENNLKGLDKYFLLNNSISILSQNYWNLFENEFENKIGKYESFFDDAEFNKPLFNNKMLRIQSNFFNLEIEFDSEKNVVLTKDRFKISGEDSKEFKLFNNFIDESSSVKFINLLDDISKTRVIRNEKHYLKTLLESAPDMNKYFEFKTNNLKKIFIYNEIKKEN